jgi:hypothetical protein
MIKDFALAAAAAVLLALLMCAAAGYRPTILGGDGTGALERATTNP